VSIQGFASGMRLPKPLRGENQEAMLDRPPSRLGAIKSPDHREGRDSGRGRVQVGAGGQASRHARLDVEAAR